MLLDSLARSIPVIDFIIVLANGDYGNANIKRE